jgi:hypothetical protein
VAFIFQKPHLAMINYSMQLINIYIKSIWPCDPTPS